MIKNIITKHFHTPRMSPVLGSTSELFFFFCLCMNFPSHKGSVADSRHYLGCQCLKLPGIGRTQRPRRRVEIVFGCGALSEDAPPTLLASTSLHGDIPPCSDVRSRVQDVLLPNFPTYFFFRHNSRRDYWSVPDSFMTTLNASLLLTSIQELYFPSSRRGLRERA